MLEQEIVRNKEAYFHYEILDTYIAGIVLKGTEVKSLRHEKPSIKEAYVLFDKGELFLKWLHIPQYRYGNLHNHEEKRERKLLLSRNELLQLQRLLQQKGLTAIPLSLFFKKGLVKVVIGVGRGKKLFDKRRTQKERELDRQAARECLN